MGKFPSFKVFIQSPEHSERVQSALRGLGYDWHYSPYKGTNKFTDKFVLYTDTEGTLFNDDCIDDVDLPEVILKNFKLEYVNPLLGSLYALPPIYYEQSPLGLRPRSIHDGKRLKEILEAMTRYAEANKPIPDDWIGELFVVNKGAHTKLKTGEVA